MFAKGTEITHAVVIKKLNEILQARGKKGTDRWDSWAWAFWLQGESSFSPEITEVEVGGEIVLFGEDLCVAPVEGMK